MRNLTAALALLSLAAPKPPAGVKPQCAEAPEIACEGRQPGGRSWAMLPSTTCLEDLTLRGIVKGPKGYRAMFESRAVVPPKSFVLETGSELFDATVIDITPDAVVLRQVPGRDDKRCRTFRRPWPPQRSR